MYFFFFKQKTAYEMRISDWSSDVCSSDLVERREQRGGRHRPAVQGNAVAPFEIDRDDLGLVGRVLGIDGARIDVIGHFLPRILEHLAFRGRSEEHTSELQSLMRISYAVFCLKKKKLIKRD